MKLFISFALLASAVVIVGTTDFLEKGLLFLPFVEDIPPPPSCPINEMYKPCTGMCSDCTQRGRCRITECQKGCDCHSFFYRITPDGPCEPVANCPKPDCGENEVFRACGPICQKCSTIQCRSINCDYKCYCKEGFLRNDDEKCIPEENCPKRNHCLRNELWAERGPVDEYCLTVPSKTLNNKTQEVSKCYCIEGFKRNLFGLCINETLCDSIKCPGNEVHYECAPTCNTTCRNYGDSDCTEDGQCYPGCFCPPGHVVNDYRRCIPLDQCTLAEVKIIEGSETKQSNETASITTSIVDQTSNIEQSAENNNTDVAGDKYTKILKDVPTSITDQSINTTSPVTTTPLTEQTSTVTVSITVEESSSIPEEKPSSISEVKSSSIPEEKPSSISEVKSSSIPEEKPSSTAAVNSSTGKEKSRNDKKSNYKQKQASKQEILKDDEEYFNSWEV